MIYRINLQMDSPKFYREPQSGNNIPYQTVKEIWKLYPDNNFTVIGEIGGFARNSDSMDFLDIGGGKTIPILPRGSMKVPIEWVAGYVEVDTNSYIAAIRSLISFFWQR